MSRLEAEGVYGIDLEGLLLLFAASV